MSSVPRGLLLGALTVLAVGGCGGGRVETKADFVAAVRERCQGYAEQRQEPEEIVERALGDSSPPASDSRRLRAVADDVEELNDVTRRAIASVRGLRWPPEEAAAIARALRAARRAIAPLEAVDAAARDGNARAVVRGLAAVDAELRTNRDITEYGIDACR